MKRKYKATKGAQFTQSQAQLLGDAIERIGIGAQPEDLVSAARDSASPIHNLFVWDNRKAAEKYRLEQARHFINHLEVVVIMDDGERTAKAFHSVRIQHETGERRGYCSLETIIENEDLHSQVVSKAMAELTYWKAKYFEYRNYPELLAVFAAIDTATKRKPKRKARKAVA